MFIDGNDHKLTWQFHRTHQSIFVKIFHLKLLLIVDQNSKQLIKINNHNLKSHKFSGLRVEMIRNYLESLI